MGVTTIQWAQWTVNPIRARALETGKRGHFCEKVSPGCRNCYSSSWQVFRGTGFAFEIPNRGKVEIYFEPRALGEVLRRRAPTRFFWCDMTDMMGTWVPDDWIDQCFAVMALTPQHTHIVLTKRPERMRAYLSGHETEERIYQTAWEMRPGGVGARTQPPDHPFDWRWPLPHVWCGTSVEDQATADERIWHLLHTPAALRFVSYEPALAAVDFTRIDYTAQLRAFMRKAAGEDGAASVTGPARFNALTGEWFDGEDGGTEKDRRISWVIVGGESGPGARPFDLAWARQTIAQGRAAGVPVFVKQMGAKPEFSLVCEECRRRGRPRLLGEDRCQICFETGKLSDPITLRDRKGGDIREFPEDLRVREFPA